MPALSTIARTNKRCSTAAILLFAALFAMPAQSNTLPFSADYKVTYRGMHAANVSLTLTQPSDDSWYMHRRSRARGAARWLAGKKLKLDEQSWFRLEENMPVPRRFLSNKPGAQSGRRRIEIDFTDTSATVNTDKGKTETYKITPFTQDQVSAIFAVMLKMEEQQKDFSLAIIGRRGEEFVGFKVLEHATLKTPIGEFKTIHLTQKTKKRTTDYWLALEHNMIPVKIVHREKDDDGVEMSLKGLKVDKPKTLTLAP